MENREKFSSRIGFLLISAGCAIGLGNVWRFPFITGQYGGAAFVLIYLFFLIILGLPILVMEYAVGRASQKSIARSFQVLEPKGTKWHWYSYVGMAGNYLLMMFYTTVAGWMISYFFKMLKGDFVGKNPAQVENTFGTMLSDPKAQIFWMLVVIALGFLVCSLGLQNGVEKITTIMMSCLFIVILVLIVRSVTLDGASAGLKFYLIPDFEAVKKQGVMTVVSAAMGQAFFTLSLGIGAIAIFGSYIDKSRRLTGEAISVAILDTLVALMAGSRIWGAMFFLFMSFAALSTIIAVFQNILSFAQDLWGWSLKKAIVFNAVLIIVLSLPCALGFNVWSFIQPLGAGTTIQDLEDFIVSNNILPIGSLIYLLFCVTKYGWGWDNFMKEANEGKGIKFPKWPRIYITYILPLIVLFILVQGYIEKF